MPSAWWGQGGGAWGCWLSHTRVMQDAWRDGHNRVLVVEDDAVTVFDAEERMEEFFTSIPDDWGQIYLGGQHQRDPELREGYLKCKSINRTHCYGLHGTAR